MLVKKKGDAVKDIFRAGGGGAAPNNLGAIMQCVWAAVDGRLPTTTGWQRLALHLPLLVPYNSVILTGRGNSRHKLPVLIRSL